MALTYDHKEFEPKWQELWEKNHIYKSNEDISIAKEKRFYILDMFPYPSGAGLHVGHPEGYTASDILARYKRMNGFNVLHPMGWDAFGLPAENYAIKTGVQPRISTEANVNNFRRQIKNIGFSYDWDREIDTTDPKYFKWTQWIFTKLFEKGLAYEATFPINWCPSCKTGMANEEVVDGKCERCHTEVGKKNIRQWMLKITAYAEKLLDGLNDVDWPEPIKQMQRNWIGRSEGAEVDFSVENSDQLLTIYTTRPDTLFGATYMVVAPEHSMLEEIVPSDHKSAVDEYIKRSSLKSDTERMFLSKEKTGVFSGAYAINPVNQARVPIWVADYVLISYGTGAIMAVPAHDERDYEFAKTFDINIVEVISNDGKPSNSFDEAYVGKGIALNSGDYNGLDSDSFKAKIIADLEKQSIGKGTVNYKLRDWVFSRQRYWGEPIPIVHCDVCGVVSVPEDQLPLELPIVDKYEPSGTGESPLVNIKEWINTQCPTCGKAATRESNTMPQWAGSSWYYLRYIDPENDSAIADIDKLSYWLPVDSYIGGAEHAVLHLLYSRFWHLFLYDIGVVPTKEPYQRLTNQGLIMGEDGQKMSKSLGNVINPDDVIEEYGADVLRMYEMFMGPLEMSKPWSTKSISGCRRYLDKVWRLFEKPLDESVTNNDIEVSRHKAIKKVTDDLEGYKFNTAISALMIFLNDLGKQPLLKQEWVETLLLLTAPFAPHLTEELWAKLGKGFSIHQESWPVFDSALLKDDMTTFVFQVNGKVRAKKELPVDADNELLLAEAKDATSKYLEGKSIVKEIVIPKKLVNLVVK
jgi:leucyl-tRNA synthetase